jgi:hypothetical protein
MCVRPAGSPMDDFSPPLSLQSRGLRQKPCTTLPDRIRGVYIVIPSLPPFSFGPRSADATTPPA